MRLRLLTILLVALLASACSFSGIGEPSADPPPDSKDMIAAYQAIRSAYAGFKLSGKPEMSPVHRVRGGYLAEWAMCVRNDDAEQAPVLHVLFQGPEDLRVAAVGDRRGLRDADVHASAAAVASVRAGLADIDRQRSRAAPAQRLRPRAPSTDRRAPSPSRSRHRPASQAGWRALRILHAAAREQLAKPQAAALLEVDGDLARRAVVLAELGDGVDEAAAAEIPRRKSLLEPVEGPARSARSAAARTAAARRSRASGRPRPAHPWTGNDCRACAWRCRLRRRWCRRRWRECRRRRTAARRCRGSAPSSAAASATSRRLLLRCVSRWLSCKQTCVIA